MKHLDAFACVFLLISIFSMAAVAYQYSRYVMVMDDMRGERFTFFNDKATALTLHEDAQFFATHSEEITQVLALTGNSASGTSLNGKPDGSDSGANVKVQWVNVLQSAKAQLGIEEMSFDIYPSQLILPNDSDLLVSVSYESLDLKLSILHDGKFAALMSYLEANAPGAFVMSSLEMKRIESIDGGTRKYLPNQDASPASAAAINLEVFCTIKWHSIDFVAEGSNVQS